MPFDPIIAEIRFGTGLSPVARPPESVADMLDRLTGPDRAALAYPIPTYGEANPSDAAFRDVNRQRREVLGTDASAAAEAVYDAMVDQAQAQGRANLCATLARAATTEDGLRERLTWFWADHFTVRSKSGITAHLVTPYVEEAIRPHVTGTFGDLLRAAILHPMMLLYLDQTRSAGPNSDSAQRQPRGLNENLARELLELHTVGVDGPYDQADVRELAELLTGLGWDADRGVVYRPDDAEPGAETVMGIPFSPLADLWTVEQALNRLALHPATARHIAFKLARHFVADIPDPALVTALELRFNATGGDLLAVTRALLDHLGAWDPQPRKVKPPLGYITSALRALGVDGAQIFLPLARDVRRCFSGPLATMGQAWELPPDPDGWPEDGPAWVTPQFMAGRIDWAMTIPERLLPDLPDPRDFALAALGPNLPDAVGFAAGAAEDRAVGIGVTLAAAAFQRR